MINIEQSHAQWYKEKSHLAQLFLKLYEDQPVVSPDRASSSQLLADTSWGFFIYPLLNGLYANDPDISFCSYMWGFSEALETLIREHQNFDIRLFSQQITKSSLPPVTPVFDMKSDAEDADIPSYATILPLRALRDITSLEVHALYSLEIYRFLCGVALKIVLRCLQNDDLNQYLKLNTDERLAARQDIMQEIDICQSALRMTERFRGNVMMPLMTDLTCLHMLFSDEATAIVISNHDEKFLNDLYHVVMSPDTWIGELALISVPLLYESLFLSSQPSTLNDRIQKILLNSTSCQPLVTYQAWILNHVLWALFCVDPDRADLILKLLWITVQNHFPKQQDNFFEALLPIYLENRNYTIVKLSNDDVDGWLHQLPEDQRASLTHGGIYLLTKSLQLHYRKGEVQQILTTGKNVQKLKPILELFPKEYDEVHYVQILLRVALTKLFPHHQVIFYGVAQLIELSWVVDDYQLSLDLARPLARLALLEDSFPFALRLVLATLPKTLLKDSKHSTLQQWMAYSEGSPSRRQIGHKISNGLITGWCDFAIYAQYFPDSITCNFQTIFGHLDDSLLHSAKNFQHMLATIERLQICITENPRQIRYSLFQLYFYNQMLSVCLINPHLQKDRAQAIANVLNIVVNIDEKQVPYLLKYMLFSPYLKEYFQLDRAAEPTHFQKPWCMSLQIFMQRVEAVILPKKHKKIPPISLQTDDSAFTYSQATVLLIVLVLVLRQYKSFDILPNQKGWQNWIIHLFTQLHHQDRDSLLGKCLAELVIVSHVQQYLPASKQAEFLACIQLTKHEKIKSIEEILAELALCDKPVATTHSGNKKSHKKLSKKMEEPASSAAEPVSEVRLSYGPQKIPVQNIASLSKKKLKKPMVIREEKDSEIEDEEVFTPDKLEKYLQRSWRMLLRFIQNNRSIAHTVSPIFQQIIHTTEQTLLRMQPVLPWAVRLAEQESENISADSPESYALQWNRLLSQYSIGLLKYSERKNSVDNTVLKECCLEALQCFNASYFRDPAHYLTDELNNWLQRMLGNPDMAGWDSYMTGGVCLDQNFFDIDLILVRNTNYISIEQIDKEIWPKQIASFSQIHSERIFDNGDCVQYKVTIRLRDNSYLKMDVTIYTRVSSELKVIEDTSHALVSTAAVRWRLDGRMLMSPTTALAVCAKKPVVKMLGTAESLLGNIKTQRNKLGYLCKQIFKCEQYRVDPLLYQVLEDAAAQLRSGAHEEWFRTRFEEACAYLLDENRFTRPQAAIRFILTRYNLLEMLYSSPNLDDVFHRACVTGFSCYFGMVLDTHSVPLNCQLDITPVEFLAMYFFSGLMLLAGDCIKYYEELVSRPTIGGVPGSYVVAILSYLPLDIYQCFWQQQSTQAFCYPPMKDNPVVSATRILRYWQFPSVPMQEAIWDTWLNRLSPGTDSLASSDDSAIETKSLARRDERYGRFHQPAIPSGASPEQSKNVDKDQRRRIDNSKSAL